MRRYRRRRRKRVIRILLFLIVIIALFFISKYLRNLIFKNTEGAQKIDVVEKIDASQFDKIKIIDEPAYNIRVGISIPKVFGTDYKPNTPHNYLAEKYSYPTKDVYEWIFNPSSYTSDKKIVFLTFDDGPSQKNTPQILDILEKNKVHATFFVVGTSLEKKGSSEIIKRELKSGHSVGYHSYTHRYDLLYPNGVASPDSVISEIEKENELIREITGIKNFKSTIFRYPGGHMSWKNVQIVDEKLAEMGIYNLDWNALTGDAEPVRPGEIKRLPLDNIKHNLLTYGYPKVVSVLMHDTKDVNLPYLEDIIKYFKDNGYEFGILG